MIQGMGELAAARCVAGKASDRDGVDEQLHVAASIRFANAYRIPCSRREGEIFLSMLHMEHKFDCEKAGTLNIYAVMKSGMKNVDNSGKSASIRSQLAQKRLDEYKAGAKTDENSQELDGKVLYSIGHGMPHGRVPIANGAVEKVDILAAVKSNNIHPTKIAHGSLVEENEQLKETNELKQTNVLLMEENSVNRELILRFYADFGKEPPADLLNRLANIDARRHQVHHMQPLTQTTCTAMAMTWTLTMVTTRAAMTSMVTRAMMACTVAMRWMVDTMVMTAIYGDEGCGGMYGCDEMDSGDNGGS